MPSGVYNKFKTELMIKTYDLVADDIKVALMTNLHSFNPDHNVWADVSANEIAGTGYTAGGQSLTNKTVSQDNTNDKGVFDANDVSWTGATLIAYHAVCYDNTPATKPLVFSIDFGGAQQVTNGTFTITWNANGIINIT